MQPRRLAAALLTSAVLATGLSGCMALPPVVTLASLGIDLGSFALTGKTASDHLLSAAAGEDCRLSGVLEGEICREEREFEAALAVLEPLPGDIQLASGLVPDLASEEEGGAAADAPQLLAEAASEAEKPNGFKVPSGTVVTEEPELPLGGFSFGDGKSRRLTVPGIGSRPATQPAAEATAEAAGDPTPESQRSAEAEGPDLAGYLSDNFLPGAANSTALRQLSEGLGGAAFLSQTSMAVATDS